ncbi:MAG: PKD domain-containing protein [Putridiphycobacter sp.]
MRLFTAIIFIFFGTFSFASHIIGGEMYYDCLGNNQYRITVKLYRDCLSTGAEYDDPLPLTVFDGNGNNIGHIDIAFPGSVQLDPSFNGNPCVTAPSDICVEEAVYEKVVTLPPSTTGYTIAYQRCCRTPDVTNLTDPGSQGLTLTCEIPAENVATCNSSPRFTNFPPLLLCANEELIFDHSATEPDGDQIVYELCTPFQGATALNPAPNTVPDPPFDLIVWGSGITETNPFGQGTISIDANTGLLTATPELNGLYIVGVCAKEYRNGVYIGKTVRDFIFRVFNCEIELSAGIVPQENLTTFVDYCQGTTIEFENSSFGADIYEWDFGVSGITSDVSNEANPSYTFPGEGTYVVTLVASKVQGCSDTTERTFIIYDDFDPDFTPPDSQCIVNNSFDFLAEGTLPSSTTFDWDFGGFAAPSSSTDINPTGIVFSQSGDIPITLTANYEVCTKSVTKNIFIFKKPTIDFTTIDELKCAPYTAHLINQSSADSPIFSFWDLDDNATSTDTHPYHTYEQPGLYDITLTIWTASGCIDTLTLSRPNLIEVFPSPTSIFEVSPYEKDQYEADFTFVDLSDTNEVVEQWFYFGNGAFTPFSPFTYTYPEPGIYYPYQIVENQYGCQHSTKKQIKVNPVIPIMVPNAFTPDGDTYNNTFKPVLYKPQQYEMLIYNRWGELIYYSNDAYGEWDGTYQGEPVPTGVYLWRIVYNEYDTGLPKQIQGHVTLLR